ARPQRIVRIPHVIGPASEWMSGEESPAGIEIPQKISQDRRNRLARKQQRIAKDKSYTSQDDRDVANVKEILRAPDMPVNRCPESQPNKAPRARPYGNPGCGYGHFECRYRTRGTWQSTAPESMEKW